MTWMVCVRGGGEGTENLEGVCVGGRGIGVEEGWRAGDRDMGYEDRDHLSSGMQPATQCRRHHQGCILHLYHYT